MKIRERLSNQLQNLSKADLHIHSNFSDAYSSIEEILEYVEKHTDLAVIAITDHDTIDGAKYAIELSKKKKYRFEIIVGEEVTSDEGHILALFIHQAIPPGLTVHETIKRIKEQGGIVIPAHPIYHTRVNILRQGLSDGIGAVTLLREKDNFDAIETVNATPTMGEENLRAKYINRTLLLKAEVGCSDAHILEAIGKGYTLFEGTTKEDLKEAILERQTQAVNDKWDILSLGRYLFFFWPKGVRILIKTLFHGPAEKRPEVINFPRTSKLKRNMSYDDKRSNEATK